ncbi:alpha/beta hydrolase [Cytophagaceae bacterium ABcell3]|nr:alpha/beta hydrolase [Cytophagaceae bacterium ABcell3]
MQAFSLKALVSAYRVYFRMAFRMAPEKAAKRALSLFATPINQKVRAKEKLLLEKASRSYIDFEGMKICVYRWGKSSKKVLCIHGWEGNGDNFGGIAEQLVKEGFEVVAYDQPAHYRSTGRSSNLLQFSRLSAFLIKSEKPSCVVGHSFGSASGIVAFHDHPDLQVEKFIMLSVPDKLISVVNDYARLMRFTRTHKMHLLNYMNRVFGRQVEDIQMNRYIGACNSQMLLIHDKYDKVIPFSYAKNVARGNDKVNLFPIAHAGHYRMLWDPKVISEVSNFVKI